MSSAAMGRTRCPVCCPLSLFRPSVVDEVAPDVDRLVHRWQRGVDAQPRSTEPRGIPDPDEFQGSEIMVMVGQRRCRDGPAGPNGWAASAGYVIVAERAIHPFRGVVFRPRVVAPPDREVKRGGIRRPGEVRRIEQARGTVDARRGSRGGRDGGHECADDRGACAGSAGAEEDWRPCGIQPELQPPEPERGSPLGVGRSCDSMRGVRHLCVEHGPGRAEAPRRRRPMGLRSPGYHVATKRRVAIPPPAAATATAAAYLNLRRPESTGPPPRRAPTLSPGRSRDRLLKRVLPCFPKRDREIGLMIVFCGASESDAVAINNVPVNEDFGGRGGRVEDRGLGDQDTACGCGCRHRLLDPLGKSRALPNSRLQTRRSLGRWILAITPDPPPPSANGTPRYWYWNPRFR